MTPPPAQFVWCEPTGLGRNVFALFLLRVELPDGPAVGTLHLFADSLYRLTVNGVVRGYGPARFLPAHPEFDSYDLGADLRPGWNEILVEVNARGASSYQAVPSVGGFIAWGRIAAGGVDLDLATPGPWRVHPAEAWDRWAEPFSFAQGPVEICDRRRLPNPADPAAWADPVPCARPEHWGPLAPRSFAGPSLRWRAPERLVLAAPLLREWERHGFRADLEVEARAGRQPRQPFFTHLFSPCAQEVTLGMFWGPTFLNGVELAHQRDPAVGNREVVVAQLEPGWNFLFGLPEVLASAWPFLLELPAGRGLELAAMPDRPESSFFLGAPLSHDEYLALRHPRPPARVEELAGFPHGWRSVPARPLVASPAREMSWDRPGPAWLRQAPAQFPLTLPTAEGRDATIVLDLGQEFIGHLGLTITAPAGTIVDLANDERLREDGCVDFFLSHWGVNSADRLILRGGRETVEGFHERGGRYLQITIRGAGGPVLLERVGVRETLGDYPLEGSFASSDPVLDWAWRAGAETQRRSMTDGWIDPWRERGLYLGDAKVEAHATRCFTRDWRLERWALRLWSHAQFPDGQIPDVAPSHHQHPLLDYTLIWVWLLRDYWCASGDTALVEELWDTIPRIFASPVWQPAEEGLWAVREGFQMFLDWGKVREEARGTNASLNAFRHRALLAAAELAAATGRSALATRYTEEAAEVAVAFSRVFWDPARQRFAAARLGGQLSDVPSYHANALALGGGLGDEAQRAGALAYLRAGLAENLELKPGHLEIYFIYFALDALYRCGESALAESVIRSHYGLMQRHGAWTLWECLDRGLERRGSFCHGWSAGGMVYLTERVLGVRPLQAGRPEVMLCAPEAETVDWAEGRVPHPAGLIEVAWRVAGDTLHLQARAPAGVRLEIRPAGRLARLRPRVEVVSADV